MSNKNRTYELYITTNLITGCVYGGKHTYINKRGMYLGSGYRLKRAIIKHGIENFNVRILRLNINNDNDLNNREIRLIRLLKYIYGSKCYNLHVGGNGGNLYKYLTPEERLDVNKRISEGKKEQYRRGETTKQILGRQSQSLKLKHKNATDVEFQNRMALAQKRGGESLTNRLTTIGPTEREKKRNYNNRLYGHHQYTFNIVYPNGDIFTETISSKRFKLKYKTDDLLFSTLAREGYFKIKKRSVHTKHNFPTLTEFIIINK